MKKFENSEIFYSSIKTHPRVRFFCYDGKIYYNNTAQENLYLSKFLLLESETASGLPYGSILTDTSEAILTEDGDYLLIE